MKLNTQYALEETLRLLSIHSPTGYTRNVTDHLLAALSEMGFSPVRTRKGAVCCCLGGQGHPLALAAHVDTLGLMVRHIQSNGHLSFTRVGGPSYQAVETENVTVVSREGKRFSGVVQLKNASTHVNHDMDGAKRDHTTMEVLLDENVSSADDVRALGIDVGDFICLDPRSRLTESGYIRSRFLDDKLSAGMLMALAKGVSEGAVKLARKVYVFFSVYEEVGHGASSGLPQDVEDLLVVDMGCVGDELTCTEMQVSICAKDSGGPYDYEMTGELISLCKANEIDYAVDVYPYYGSDAGTALRSGRDIRYALIGAGVYASHGYERSHKKGVENSLRLIEAYVEKE
ncbi:MAG: M42 family metallopeptidase [bacterium]|nr:M42 family metallopeptidase [bacterium]